MDLKTGTNAKQPANALSLEILIKMWFTNMSLKCYVYPSSDLVCVLIFCVGCG